LASKPKPRQVALTTDTILEWPNGDLVADDIAQVLFDAHLESLGNSAVVQYCKEKRVKGFDPDHPEWESVPKKGTVGQLKRMYKEAEGRDFDPEEYSKRRPKPPGFNFGED
jgi:hypothetical protein